MEKLIRAGVGSSIYVKMTRRSPLSIAAKNGHLGIVQVLLEMGEEDVNWGAENGELPLVNAVFEDVPLIAALKYGHIDTARFLVSRGAVPDLKISVDGGRTALSLISQVGPLASVQFLVEETTSDMEAQDYGDTPLIHAASYASLETVKYLVKAGADVTATKYRGKTALFEAGQRGRTEICHFLLSTEHSNYLLSRLDGMSLAYINSEGNGLTAHLLLSRMDHNAIIASDASSDELVPFLFSAASGGLYSLVQHLLEKGCGPLTQVLVAKKVALRDGIIYHKYDNALRQAAANDHTRVVQLLLHSIHAQDPLSPGPSIIDIIPIAAENNAVRLLQDILDCNQTRQLDPAKLKTCISEALMLTASHEEATQLLLNYGASPDQDGNGGYKFLHEVLLWGTRSSVKMLLEVTGLDPLQTFSGNYGLELTSLLEVAALEGDLEMIKQLLEADKVNFHPSNKECQQALSCAIGSTYFNDKRVECMEVVKYFLSHGFDANCRAIRGYYAGTPLLSIAAAIHEWSGEIINLLLSHGAEVHNTDDLQQTALCWAAIKGNHAAVATLLDHGADPFHKDNEGDTPLGRSVSGYVNQSFRTLLRAIETRGVKGDLIGLLEKTKLCYHKCDTEKGLKYLKQHLCRLRYPCPAIE